MLPITIVHEQEGKEVSGESCVRPEMSDPAGILPIQDSHHADVQLWHKSPCESAARP